ncbi:ABC transporter permease subunit [Leucobacter soli]|uniref:ABC transporter permease subunit n=1 Tax=Leucobacter soli TaxID=2812850 RepID=UPI003615117A
MIIIASFGNNPIVLVVSVSLVFAPRVGRLARASTHQVVVRDYIQAAEARGESLGSVLFREVMPNIAGPMIADTALRLTYAVVFVASLNFLGLGEQPPSSDWGLAVSAGRVCDGATLGRSGPRRRDRRAFLSINLVAEALTREVVRTPEGASL